MKIVEVLSSTLDRALGGVGKGKTINEWVAYTNSTIQHASLWGQALVVAKVDIRRMFASVARSILARTLQHFEVPAHWINLIMHQVVSNRFLLKTVHGEVVNINLRQGFVEGAPTSVILVGLVLTSFFRNLAISSRLHGACFST